MLQSQITSDLAIGRLIAQNLRYAMTGLRLGYLATNDDLIVVGCRKLLRLTTNGVSSITQ